jgi:response regulator RpfG family c-di-GMP phosphodiesterase
MASKILIVDDESNVLSAFKRSLRQRYELDFAAGAEEALKTFAAQGPYAVVVSDMQMPYINGVELLSKIRQLNSDTVRIMLTGNADQQTAVDAVNAGNIFRFLNKPCPPDILAKALDAGLEQHRLIISEKELLNKTLSGSVSLLTEVLSLVNPMAFGRASRVRRVVRNVCEQVKINNAWQVEIAAMLSQVGCVTIPAPILERYYSSGNLTEAESLMIKAHPKVGYDLVVKIPRLETVANLIAYQNFTLNELQEVTTSLTDDEKLGAKVLKVVLDYDILTQTFNRTRSLHTMRYVREGDYDLTVLHALAELEGVNVHPQVVSVDELEEGMILDDHVLSDSGELLVSEGHEITASVLARLKSFSSARRVREPIRVRYQKERLPTSIAPIELALI